MKSGNHKQRDTEDGRRQERHGIIKDREKDQFSERRKVVSFSAIGEKGRDGHGKILKRRE